MHKGFIALILLLIAFIILIVFGIKKEASVYNACEARGGTVLDTRKGWECFKLEKI